MKIIKLGIVSSTFAATPTTTTTTTGFTTSSYVGSSWNPYKCGSCGCCCRPEHADECRYDIFPYLTKNWNCESGEWFGWDNLQFVGTEAGEVLANTIEFCQKSCNTVEKCGAFTFDSNEEKCTLFEASRVHYSSDGDFSEGFFSAQKCRHIPIDSPERDPDFYLQECKNDDFNWMGRKLAKLLYYGDKGTVEFRLSLKDDQKAYSLRNGEYHGFMAFTKKQCGNDFLKALTDGRVSWNILDSGNFYHTQFEYFNTEGPMGATILQFWREEFGAKKDLGSKTSDKMMVILSGLDKVDFGRKNFKKCILKVIPGSAQITERNPANKNLTKCAWESNTWW